MAKVEEKEQKNEGGAGGRGRAETQEQVCEGNQVLGHTWHPVGCSVEESTDPKGPTGLNPYPRVP